MKNHKLIQSSLNEEAMVISVKYEGGAWADMIIIPKNNGEFWNVILNTDWGVWTYSWGKSGISNEDIYSFLGSIGSDYLIDKFTKGREKIYDGDTTAEAIRAHLRKCYTEKELELENFEDELEEVEMFETINDFNWGLGEGLTMILRGNSHEFIREKWHPREKYFFEEIFPDLIEMVKNSGIEYTRLRP